MISINITKPLPNQPYDIWIRAKPYVWPRKKRFVFGTLTNRPSAPGKPTIDHLRGDVHQVTWTPAHNNGALIEEYSLESLKYRSVNRAARSTNASNNSNKTLETSTLANDLRAIDEPKSFADEWTKCYSGNETYWIIKYLDKPIAIYSFRVRARNAHGWSEYSNLSEPKTKILALAERTYVSIAVGASAFVVVLIVVFSCIICGMFLKKRFQNSKTRRSDVKMARVQSVRRNGIFMQYNISHIYKSITDGDIVFSPQIQCDEILFTNILGSGAFGEVYEGFVQNVGSESQTRVAIKTLKKDSTEQEKEEFLQEAQLMSNFKHKNILSLIGVFFYTDSLCIIMELMQGGDMLSFLRQRRSCNVSFQFLFV